MHSDFFKFPSYNFVPIQKTPWGGTQIAQIKKIYLSQSIHTIPERIGESFEAQIDNFLLKWIDAIEPLSVQVHPDNSNPFLKTNECGKPEAWFVQNLQNPTPVYLGFKEGYSKEDIEHCLQSEQPDQCLHSFIPSINDYISVPTGCVHALGAGILIAEPQRILPRQEGKTWRIFDWNRYYNLNGERDAHGLPRELHIQQALSAIDWTLPRGQHLEKILVTHLKHGDRFLGDKYNPFCVELLTQEGMTNFESLVKDQFSVITVFSGEVKISSATDVLHLHAGETGFIPNADCVYTIDTHKTYGKSPCALIFALK